MEWGGEGPGMNRGIVRCNCMRMCSRHNYCAASSVGIESLMLSIPIQHMELASLFTSLPMERLMLRPASCTRSYKSLAHFSISVCGAPALCQVFAW